MNTFKTCLVFAVSACAVTAAHAQVSLTPQSQVPPSRLTHEATSSTGSILNKETRWSSKIPLNKTYGELTPEQKSYFHAMYESIAPGDEPPFPLEGMKPIVTAIRKAQAMRQATGELSLAVTVGADGKARQVADYGSLDDPEMTKFASSVLLMTQFKPAVCGGAPCTMQFPFTMKLKRE
jgi:hypothetical protein